MDLRSLREAMSAVLLRGSTGVHCVPEGARWPPTLLPSKNQHPRRRCSTTIFAPAYGLHSTALDYGCFLETMLRNGEDEGVPLLEAETARLATRPHSDYVYSASEREDRYSYYGLHRFVTIESYDPADWDAAAHMFGHGGAWGTTAWADRLHDLVFVYFTQSRNSETMEVLRDLVHVAQID